MNEASICQTCHEEVEDIRYIRVDCFYDLSEVSPLFEQTFVPGKKGSLGKNVYAIRVCKGCRAVFMFDFLKTFVERGGQIRRESLTDTSGNQKVSLQEYNRIKQKE